eukprot:COSAG05_NODE_1867_length_3930_cov_3.096842_7_plen_100_part_01
MDAPSGSRPPRPKKRARKGGACCSSGPPTEDRRLRAAQAARRAAAPSGLHGDEGLLPGQDGGHHRVPSVEWCSTEEEELVYHSAGEDFEGGAPEPEPEPG